MKFCCSICLDLLKDPVTIPCGHNYCMTCINAHWNRDEKKTYSCPQCQKIFEEKPALVKNVQLAELVEELKKPGSEHAPFGSCFAEPEDVACDVCSGRKMKALKSCRVCLASYCEQHLQPHYENPTFRKHQLVEASMKLQETICTRHNEVMKMFCRTDHKCICYHCFMDEHKGHNVVSAAAEKEKRQKEIQVAWQEVQQRIHNREKDVKVLQQEVESINSSAITAVMNTEKISTELVEFIRKIFSEVKQQIRSKQKREVGQAKELQEKLTQEIGALKKRERELEQLSKTEDPTQFLQDCHLQPQPDDYTDSPSRNVQHLDLFDEITAAVTATRDRMEVLFKGESNKLSLIKTNVEAQFPQAQSGTRTEFLQYARQITLDPHTANPFLEFSEGNRKVTFQKDCKPHNEHPNAFVHMSQVLSKFGLIGRCYWEVEKKGDVAIGVEYKNIPRAGAVNAPAFGCSERSWVLHCGGNNYTFKHNKSSVTISAPPSSRVGVYLDHDAGILSFYNVDETMLLLHRIQTTFTQPLYAGLGLAVKGDTAELCRFQ